MYSRKRILTLALILAEVCYLFPLYRLTAIGLGYSPALAPGFLPALAAAATIINFKLSGRAYRNFTIVFANLVLLVAAGLAAALPRHGSAADSIVIYILLLWVFCRAIYLVRRNTDVFLHFDFSIAVIFFILLIADFAKAPLAGGTAWLAASFLLNIVAISLLRGGGEADGHLPWLGAGLAAVVLVPLFLTARSFFPYLFQPAQFLYDLGRPVAELFKYLLYIFLSGYFRFNAKTEGSPREPADSGFLESSAGAAAESPWFALIAKVLYWLLIIITIAAVLALFLYLMSLLLNWLLKRQVIPSSPGAKTPNLFSWRRLLCALSRFFEIVGMLILPCLPVRIGAAQAYRALLKWGLYRRCPRKSCETPYEYLDRLKMRFPGCRQELMAITASYVQFRYGQDHAGSCSPGDLRMSLRRLYIPRIKIHII